MYGLQPVVVAVALVGRHRDEVRRAEALELAPEVERVGEHEEVRVERDEARGGGEELRLGLGLGLGSGSGSGLGSGSGSGLGLGFSP